MSLSRTGELAVSEKKLDLEELDLAPLCRWDSIVFIAYAEVGETRSLMVRRGSLRSPNEHDLQAIISVSRCGNAILSSNVKVHGRKE